MIDIRKSPRGFGILSALLLGATLGALALAAPTAQAGGAGGDVKIKYATLAPDGTPWMKSMKRLAREVKKKTDGRIQFKFYR